MTRMAHPRLIAFLSVPVVAMLSATAAAQNLSERMSAIADSRALSQADSAGKPRLLGALVYTDISVDFRKQTARDAVEYFKSIIGVPVVARFSTDKNATSGIDPDQEIDLTYAGPALTVLERMLELFEGDSGPCTWQLRDGFIEIGPKERLIKSKEVRLYPVRDLLFDVLMFDNAPDFNLNAGIQQGGGGTGGGGSGGGGGFGGGGGGGGSGGGGGGLPIGNPGEAPVGRSLEERIDDLMGIILETIEPDSWVQTGGECTIRYYNDVLIVKAPDYMHRQLGGYPFFAQPKAQVQRGGRYVTFNAPLSVIQNVQFTTAQTQGAAGGGTFGGGGGTGGGNPIPASTPSGTTTTPPAGTSGGGGATPPAGTGGSTPPARK